jgi:hypothetical protein
MRLVGWSAGRPFAGRLAADHRDAQQSLGSAGVKYTIADSEAHRHEQGTLAVKQQAMTATAIRRPWS